MDRPLVASHLLSAFPVNCDKKSCVLCQKDTMLSQQLHHRANTVVVKFVQQNVKLHNTF